MRSFYFVSLALAPLLAQSQSTVQAPKVDAAKITGEAQFNAIAQSIILEYIPSRIRPGLAIAVQSAAAAANVTGNINSIFTSALTAATPPPFLTALPSQYKGPVGRVGSALDSIREAISSISAASAGAVASASIASLNGTLQTNSSAILISTTDSSGSRYATVVPATIQNGTKIPITPVSTVTSGDAAATTSAPTASSSSVSSGLAMATQVPVAAAGILGMLGLIVVL